MRQQIAHIALVVKDYDEAIAFYIQKLQFKLVEDTKLSEIKRWVMVAPPGNSNTCLLLAKAATPEQAFSIGNQTGGRVVSKRTLERDDGFFFFFNFLFS